MIKIYISACVHPTLQGTGCPQGRSPCQIFQESYRIELEIQQDYSQALTPPGNVLKSP